MGLASSYGPHRGGPDPLAPPLELREVVDAIGAAVLSGASPRSALNAVLRRGTRSMPGLDELTRRLWYRRSEFERRYRLDGTLEEVRRLLDEAVAAERRAVLADPSDEAGRRRAWLDALPPGTAAAVSALADYAWSTAAGRENAERIRVLLGEQVLRSRFEGTRQTVAALQARDSTSPERVEQVNRMLLDLNALLSARAQGFGDIEARFVEFLRRHNGFFAKNPRDVDELIDALGVRAAAAQRLLNSLAPKQRRELLGLSHQAFGDARIIQRLSELDDLLRVLRPELDWTSPARFRGNEALQLADGVRAMVTLAELEALGEQLWSHAGARWEAIDLDAWERHFDTEAAEAIRRLSELEHELRAQGLLEGASGGELRLTPKAVRRLGEAALADVLRSLRPRAGRRDTRSAGAGGEPTGTTRPWRFGDTEPWDVSRTVRNAVLRIAAEGGGRVRLDVSDVEVVETEHRARTAVALCVDTSWSMVAEGRRLSLKRAALALHHLVVTRFRDDALRLVTFGRHARSVQLGDFVGMAGVEEQGTDLQHTLLLAERHLRRYPGARPVVFLVVAGEPTEWLKSDGAAEFSRPPTSRTLAGTLSQVDRVVKLGASLTVFRLGGAPRLVAFADLLARRSGGRVVVPEIDGLGAAVVGDYLRRRRG